MSWRDVPDTEEAVYGVTYRTSVPLAQWSIALAVPAVMNKVLAIGAKIAEGRAEIVKTEIFAPGGIPADWVARGYRATDWGVRITWRKVAGGTPILVYAAAVAIVIGVATLSWVVVAKFTEKEFAEFNEEIRATGDKLTDWLKNTLFNPGVIVSAVVVIALFLRRRR